MPKHEDFQEIWWILRISKKSYGFDWILLDLIEIIRIFVEIILIWLKWIEFYGNLDLIESTAKPSGLCDSIEFNEVLMCSSEFKWFSDWNKPWHFCTALDRHPLWTDIYVIQWISQYSKVVQWFMQLASSCVVVRHRRRRIRRRRASSSSSSSR